MWQRVKNDGIQARDRTGSPLFYKPAQCCERFIDSERPWLSDRQTRWFHVGPVRLIDAKEREKIKKRKDSLVEALTWTAKESVSPDTVEDGI